MRLPEDHNITVTEASSSLGSHVSAPVFELSSVLVIRNPVAGQRRGRRFQEGLKKLRRMVPRVEVCDTLARGDALQHARDAEGDLDAIIAAGGDGTINEVITGLMARPDGPLPLGILPLGTANVLAHELGLPIPAGPAVDVICRGAVGHIHLGQANGHPFAMMAGAGFDALVVEDLPTGLKRLVGKGAYVWQTARQWLRPLPGPYQVTFGDERVKASAVIAANGHYYGGRFVVAPAARLTESSLELCLFLGAGRWAALRALLGLVTGRAHRLKDVRIVSVRAARIEGPSTDPVQADGDIVTRLPVDLSIMATPLPVILPNAAAV